MIKKNMLKEYLRYILPTMLTFTLASVYSIVDGMFVGHAVGDAGVAGINVAFPLVAFVMAVGTGIGMGGGVISSIARGAGDEAKSRRAVGTTFVMLLAAALPVMALLLFAAEPICRLLGGQVIKSRPGPLPRAVRAAALRSRPGVDRRLPPVPRPAAPPNLLAAAMGKGQRRQCPVAFHIPLFQQCLPAGSCAVVIQALSHPPPPLWALPHRRTTTKF